MGTIDDHSGTIQHQNTAQLCPSLTAMGHLYDHL